MKGILLHIAADTTTLGGVGPIFSNNTFEYIPINERYGLESRTYKDFPARNQEYGKTLADFLPSNVGRLPVHFDPEFNTFTYGEPVTEYSKFLTLQKLEEGDVLFFVASLAPFDPDVYARRDISIWHYQEGRRNKYIIGFFQIGSVTRAYVIKSAPKMALALLNQFFFLEEGKAPINLKKLKVELDALKNYGYLMDKEETYELTDDGFRVVSEILGVMDGQEIVEKSEEILKKGLFELDSISGTASEDLIKENQHYKRLRPIDFDHFIVISGKPEHSALLDHAIRLTEHFRKSTYTLTEIGQLLRKRETDNFRGSRWIDEHSMKILKEEISKNDPILATRLDI